ncbi:hypothetical protein, partial [Fischerella thermalis]|uniref:hypothetical protein n=1 Tax=Fischerella thermalis TaxID=372787 RepID=UPI001CA49A4E
TFAISQGIYSLAYENLMQDIKLLLHPTPLHHFPESSIEASHQGQTIIMLHDCCIYLYKIMIFCNS